MKKAWASLGKLAASVSWVVSMGWSIIAACGAVCRVMWAPPQGLGFCCHCPFSPTQERQ